MRAGSSLTLAETLFKVQKYKKFDKFSEFQKKETGAKRPTSEEEKSKN